MEKIFINCVKNYPKKAINEKTSSIKHEEERCAFEKPLNFLRI